MLRIYIILFTLFWGITLLRAILAVRKLEKETEYTNSKMVSTTKTNYTFNFLRLPRLKFSKDKIVNF